MSVTLSIPDMSCGHCRASIDAALKPLGAQVEFDIERRQARVTGADNAAALIAALDKIGFPAEPV